MCELFGVSSAKKINVNDLLKEFFSHGEDHPNGWGMAFFYGDGVSVEKEPCKSSSSSYLKHRLHAGIETNRMIAHIRLATKGTMEYENTHPFVRRDCQGRPWTLAHNGTIFSCDRLNKYVFSQEGATDSERILLYIIDCINLETEKKGRALSAEERFSVIDRVIHDIAPENKINLLIYDNELFYVHTNFRDTLHACRTGGGIIFSTRPLSKGDWVDVPMNTLMAYENGRLKFTGRKHEHEFFVTEENQRFLFLDFSIL